MSDSSVCDPGSAPQGQQNASEVGRLLQQIRTQHEAAERGLSGLATGWSRHEFIQKRAHKQLSLLVGQKEATQLIAETIWNPDEIAAVLKQAASQVENKPD